MAMPHVSPSQTGGTKGGLTSAPAAAALLPPQDQGPSLAGCTLSVSGPPGPGSSQSQPC